MNRVFPIIFLFLLLGGCQTLKTNRSNNKELEKFVNNAGKEKLNYSWMKLKADVSYTDKNMSQKAIMHLVFKKDSLVWGSVNAIMGIEIYRFFLSKDSIVLMDKLNRKYYSISMDFLSSMFNVNGVNYSLIENLVFAHCIFPLSPAYKVVKENNQTYLYNADDSLEKKIYPAPNKGTISSYEITRLNSGQKVVVNYSDKISSDGYTIPKVVDISYSSPDKISLVLNFLSLQFNKPVEVNTSIPKSYERVK